MSNVTGFTINTGASDLNPGKSTGTDVDGITIKGTYVTDGDNSVSNAGQYKVYVLENGIETEFKGGSISFNGGNFSFTANKNQVKDANLTDGDHVQFIFKKGDAVITTSSTVSIYCFYPGTMIATSNGEVAVEELSIGDMVVRHDGSASSIRWIGRNTVSLMFAGKMKSLPIRIKKDALAANVPSRDLLVSPDHAILVDGILAQAGALVNGTSIVREADVPSTFTYYHIELADHSLVMAENTPAESFIDNVDRANYDNWAEHEALYGDLPALVEMDLPRAKSQRQVPPATRKVLADRAVALGYSSVDSAVA